MGTSYFVKLVLGVTLSDNQLMKLSDEPQQETERRIYEVCPGDKEPNPQGKKYCGGCGFDLEYDFVVQEGVVGTYEIEEELEPYFEDLGLDFDRIDPNVAKSSSSQRSTLGKFWLTMSPFMMVQKLKNSI